MTRTGQKTVISQSYQLEHRVPSGLRQDHLWGLDFEEYEPGTSVASVQVAKNPITIALVALCQNLNSGNRLINGLNSSSCLVGNALGPPDSSSSSCSSEGSNLGVRKARNKFSR